MSGPFAAGERALLRDARNRRYLVTLQAGGTFHTHRGIVAHDDLLGRPEGSAVRATSGSSYVAVRPTLADIVLKMPRGAQVIYPKDLAAMVMVADITEGTQVIEAGVGSGALSLALLRAGAQVTGYEQRPDFAERARSNVASFSGHAAHRYLVHERDVYEGIAERELDAVMLDLPEPWRVVSHAEAALAAGGILVSYLPSVTQVAQLRAALDTSRFAMAETFEVLQRSWHVAGPSVRPDHRMVAHTGFITHARLLA